MAMNARLRPSNYCLNMPNLVTTRFHPFLSGPFCQPVGMRNKFIRGIIYLLGLCLLAENPVWANIPGGGTGTGANVTLTDSGSHGDDGQRHRFHHFHQVQRAGQHHQLHLQQRRRPADHQPGFGKFQRRQVVLGKQQQSRADVHLFARGRSGFQRRQLRGNCPGLHIGGRYRHGGPLFDAARFDGILCHGHLVPSQHGRRIWQWANVATTFTPVPSSTG